MKIKRSIILFSITIVVAIQSQIVAQDIELNLPQELPCTEVTKEEAAKIKANYDKHTSTVEDIVNGELILANGYTVRLVGVNFPETDESKTNEINEFLMKLVQNGTEVYVEDINEDIEQNNIMHAYVYFFPMRKNIPPDGWHTEFEGNVEKGLFVNATVIKSGYATPKSKEMNAKYAKLFEDLYTEAEGHYDLKANISANIHTFQYIPNPLVNFVGFLKAIFGNLIGYKSLYFLLIIMLLSLILPHKNRNKQIGFFLLLIVIPITLNLLSSLIIGYWFIQRQFVWVMPFFAFLLGWSVDSLTSGTISRLKKRQLTN